MRTAKLSSDRLFDLNDFWNEKVSSVGGWQTPLTKVKT
jgi:hypothetical protein